LILKRQSVIGVHDSFNNFYSLRHFYLVYSGMNLGHL
jgi:hypothetical protein